MGITQWSSASRFNPQYCKKKTKKKIKALTQWPAQSKWPFFVVFTFAAFKWRQHHFLERAGRSKATFPDYFPLCSRLRKAPRESLPPAICRQACCSPRLVCCCVPFSPEMKWEPFSWVFLKGKCIWSILELQQKKPKKLPPIFTPRAS